jgi:predicted nucleotidyltransferase component of viral defense system
MTKAHPSNLPASVRQRPLNISRKRGEDFNLTLTRFGIERLLYRISQSEHANRFVLKGALLLSLWTERLYRPTRDLDLLGYGDSSVENPAQVFREICITDVEPDGLALDVDSIAVTVIREGQEYQGQRVRLIARLGRARLRLQVDIGFGDVVIPEVEEVVYPAMLDFPAPPLRAYSKEAVVAEQLQAMVWLGFPNSRMKDFYDVWMLSRLFGFEGQILCQAIRSTFERRQTAIPPTTRRALAQEFAQSPTKVTQWRAFLGRNRLDVGGATLTEVIADLQGFLGPALSAASNGSGFQATWPARGPWAEGPG